MCSMKKDPHIICTDRDKPVISVPILNGQDLLLICNVSAIHQIPKSVLFYLCALNSHPLVSVSLSKRISHCFNDHSFRISFNI